MAFLPKGKFAMTNPLAVRAGKKNAVPRHRLWRPHVGGL